MPKNYNKDQYGFIHLGVAIFVLFLFAATFYTSFFLTKVTREGQVAAAMDPRDHSDPTVAEKITERVREVVENVTTASSRITTDSGEDSGKDSETTTEERSRESGSESSSADVAEAVADAIPPVFDGTQPYKGAPKCTDHKDTEYHGVWNSDKGCYYDHTHGADPSKTIFKDIVGKWTQEISYPWQTPNENVMKHQGYFYIYDEAENGCEQLDLNKGSNCITHILYMVHSMGTTVEVNARFHSYRVVARVCDPAKTKCGFVQTGGWSDYGTLHCPYKKEHCKLSVDPAPLAKDNGVLPELVSIQQPPYRTSVPVSDMDRVLKSGINPQFWNNQLINNIVSAYYPEKYNVIYGGAWSFIDSWGGIDKSNPSKLQFICQDGSCKFNHTQTQLFTARFKNLPTAPFSGFTDKKGNVMAACKEAGADCVPLIVDAGVPSGEAWLSRQVRQGDAEKAPIYEYDVCFDSAGKVADCTDSKSTTAGWIKPNTMNMSAMTTTEMKY